MIRQKHAGLELDLTTAARVTELQELIDVTRERANGGCGSYLAWLDLLDYETELRRLEGCEE